MEEKQTTQTEEESTSAAIGRLMLEMAELRSQIKTVRERLKDTMEQNDEYRAIKEELEELTNKRQAAKKILEADKDVQVIKSDLEELKFKQKDLLEIMSHHLVTHYNQTQETHITDTDGTVHQIVLSAKISRGQD